MPVIAADDLAFFEMHGTGTPAGDPVEAAAVGRALGASRREPLPIGSVKTNIGHLEPASGMAGLLKAALALERGVVPPTLHCESPNPKIDFAALNLRLVRAAEPIRSPKSVASPGSTRSVLAAPTRMSSSRRRRDPPPRPRIRPRRLPPLLISAATEASLRELAGGWRALLVDEPDERLPGLVRAAAGGRDHHRHRLAALGADRAGYRCLAGAFSRRPRSRPAFVTGTAVAESKLAFVFSGNGAQFPGMGRAALRANAAFRAAVEGVDELLRPELGWSVAERIERGVDGRRVGTRRHRPAAAVRDPSRYRRRIA